MSHENFFISGSALKSLRSSTADDPQKIVDRLEDYAAVNANSGKNLDRVHTTQTLSNVFSKRSPEERIADEAELAALKKDIDKTYAFAGSLKKEADRLKEALLFKNTVPPNQDAEGIIQFSCTLQPGTLKLRYHNDDEELTTAFVVSLLNTE